MNRIKLLFSIMMMALLFLGAACKGKGGGGNGGDEPTPSAAFLTTQEFQSSKWKGVQAVGTFAELVVSQSDITLSYYVKKSLSKNTDDKFEKVVVKIAPYTFNEKTGEFSGSGNDNFAYSGKLASKTSLNIKIPTENLNMTKE